jgi:hypothetical protein
MLSRRELIAAGAGIHLTGGSAAAAAQNEGAIASLRGDIQEIRSILTANPVSTPTVTTLRERQRQFYRINQRFPEYIDVGFRVWEAMQDWHIRNLRPLNISRTGDGRWQMDFILTVLVLKYELPENDISIPYDR